MYTSPPIYRYLFLFMKIRYLYFKLNISYIIEMIDSQTDRIYDAVNVPKLTISVYVHRIYTAVKR